MLTLRVSEIYTRKFNNKSSVKLEIWKEIAEVLLISLLNTLNSKSKLKKLGLRKETPQSFDLLDQILGQKDKITLTQVRDTIQSSQENNLLLSEHFENRDTAKQSAELLEDQLFPVSTYLTSSINSNTVFYVNRDKENVPSTSGSSKKIKKTYKITKKDILGAITTSKKKSTRSTNISI